MAKIKSHFLYIIVYIVNGSVMVEENLFTSINEAREEARRLNEIGHESGKRRYQVENLSNYMNR